MNSSLTGGFSGGASHFGASLEEMNSSFASYFFYEDDDDDAHEPPPLGVFLEEMNSSFILLREDILFVCLNSLPAYAYA